MTLEPEPAELPKFISVDDHVVEAGRAVA